MFRQFFILCLFAFGLIACENGTLVNEKTRKSDFLKPLTLPVSSSVVKILDSLPTPHTETLPGNEKYDYEASLKRGDMFVIYPQKTFVLNEGEAGGFSYMQNFNTEQGLALSTISCGYTDKKGNLWLGTYGGGVSRYDGKSFVNFSTAHGLAGNLIKSISEDSLGNMWFGANGTGVSMYNGKYFTTYTTADGLAGDFVKSITVDGLGNVWLGTNNGLSKYNYGGGAGKTLFSNYLLSKEPSTQRISCGLTDKDGNLWFGTAEGGMFRCDKHSIDKGMPAFILYTAKQGLIADDVTCMIEDKTGTLWIGTGIGVSRYDRAKNKFTNYTQDDGLIEYGLQDIKEDDEGNIWFATAKGVCRFNYADTSTANTKSRFTRFTSAQGLQNNTIYSILKDKNGDLWFGSSGAGISRYNGKSLTSFTNVQGLINDKVWSIREDKNENLLFATGAGISFYSNKNCQNGAKGEFRNFRFEQSNIRCLLIDKMDNVWFGNNAGAIKFNGKSFVNYGLKQGLPHNFVLSMAEDKKGNIWFGTYGGGVCKYDGNRIEQIEKSDGNYAGDRSDLIMKNGKYLKTFTIYSTADGLTDNTIKCIVADSKGNIWFGTNGNGVSKYTPDYKGTGKAVFTNFTKANGLPHNTVLSMMEDRSGNIWLGTAGGGICRFNDTALVAVYTSANGLANDAVYGIVEDTINNIIWFGTNQGLSGLRINSITNNQEELQFENYNATTGYPIKDANTGALYMDSKGIVWMGTSDKLVRFDYKGIRKNKAAPEVTIQAIKIHEQAVVWHNLKCKNSNDKPLSTADSLAVINEEIAIYNHRLTEVQRVAMWKKISGVMFDSIAPFYPIPQHLILPYEHNNVSFDFHAIETGRPFMVNYQYMLEGYDKDWSAVTSKTTATFGNIREGTYTFRLKAQSPEGVWSQPVTYIFQVLPPWYRTWWMYLFYLISVILSITVFIRWRERRLKQENFILEEKVQLRTRQLEEKNKIVEEQRKDVLQKNIKITDSINYAKRIQQAILPAEEYMKLVLPESFVFFKPKDIVSGDFYWLAEKNNSSEAHIAESKIILAVADCTGHGVPGAFMSMIGNTLLNEIVNVKNIYSPEQILELMNKGIVSLLHQNDASAQDDGMDISIVCIDKIKGEIEFAGANHFACLVDEKQITKLKGDVYSIGGMFGNTNAVFSKQKFKVSQGTAVYLFTDGFIDQFGGEKNAKFLSSRFEHLLQDMHSHSMEQQKQELSNAFEQWKADFNQTDDVLVIGIRF